MQNQWVSILEGEEMLNYAGKAETEPREEYCRAKIKGVPGARRLKTLPAEKKGATPCHRGMTQEKSIWAISNKAQKRLMGAAGQGRKVF